MPASCKVCSIVQALLQQQNYNNSLFFATTYSTQILYGEVLTQLGHCYANAAKESKMRFLQRIALLVQNRALKLYIVFLYSCWLVLLCSEYITSA